MESMEKGEEEELRDHQPVKRCCGGRLSGGGYFEKFKGRHPYKRHDATLTNSDVQSYTFPTGEPGTACPRLTDLNGESR